MKNSKIMKNSKMMKNLKMMKNSKMLLNKVIDFKINILNNLIYLICFFFIIYIIFVSGIIYYINSIKDCSCFIELNKSANVNIHYIYIIEIIILFLLIFNFITFIILHYRIDNIGGKHHNLYTFLIQYILILIINGYLAYNIYKLYKNHINHI